MDELKSLNAKCRKSILFLHSQKTFKYKIKFRDFHIITFFGNFSELFVYLKISEIANESNYDTFNK